MNTLEWDLNSAATENLPPAEQNEISGAAPAVGLDSNLPPRPAWIEIDLPALKRNLQRINEDKPAHLLICCVVKDEAYGHGAFRIAQTALECGARRLALATVGEAIALRERGVTGLTCCVSAAQSVEQLGRVAARAAKRVPVHLKINTGMNRYGARWDAALSLAELVVGTTSLVLEGVLSHFAQSDEADKTFALIQLARFNELLGVLAGRGVRAGLRHLCNSGGFLDLPQAHFDMVRLGILPLGVYPSPVCRRIAGIAPVMTVKARIAAIQLLSAGDTVGYGMRYMAPGPRRIAVLPAGYGDGFPRVRNQGCVLIHGRRAPLVGGVAMDALTVDITDVPQAQVWDEAVLMGRQGEDEISVHEVARLKNSVSYDVLTSWRARLPRFYLGENSAHDLQPH